MFSLEDIKVGFGSNLWEEGEMIMESNIRGVVDVNFVDDWVIYFGFVGYRNLLNVFRSYKKN